MSSKIPIMKASDRQHIGPNLILFLYCMIVIIPIWIVFVSSFKTNAQIYASPLSFPLSLRFDTYVTALFRVNMFYSIIRTILIGVIATAFALSLGFLASYAFSRIPRKETLFLKTLFISGYLVPPISLLVPIYTMMARAGLLNHPLSLILVFTARNIPTAIIVLSPFIGKIHKSMEESASIDGANLFQILWHIVLPLSRSGIISASVLSFISCWNEFFFPMVLTTSIESAVVQTSLTFLRGEQNVDYGIVSAGVMILLLTVGILYTFVQRQLVEGLSGSSVKQ